ncbi:hypothetical protein Gohar_015961, partial [Gossypium harknessii]|nr:hypothetical protein [Gossypium harknessii]
VPVRFAEEDEDVIENYSWCLVGRVFIESVVHFPSLRNTMIDFKRVVEGMPWFFNRHLIIFNKMEREEDPLRIPFNHGIFWVQVHNLPLGFFTEGMTNQFGIFIGQFLEYDTNLITRGGRTFMCIRVKLDVRVPLK